MGENSGNSPCTILANPGTSRSGQVVPQADLSAARLAEAVDAALAHPRPALTIQTDGAAVAANILRDVHDTKQATE